jgi:hypothetical protein
VGQQVPLGEQLLAVGDWRPGSDPDDSAHER